MHHGIPSITPAQLSFLAIYNPTLGPTDETFKDQVVYWHSRAAKTRRKQHGKKGNVTQDKEVKLAKEEENEKLRQVGLAQGIAAFARNFADGQAADTVDTERSIIVVKELERDWWILAVRKVFAIEKGIRLKVRRSPSISRESLPLHYRLKVESVLSSPPLSTLRKK